MLFRVFNERRFVILDLGQCQRELKLSSLKLYNEKLKVDILYSLRQGLYFLIKHKKYVQKIVIFAFPSYQQMKKKKKNSCAVLSLYFSSTTLHYINEHWQL
jgi:hypothetical protein